MASSTAASRLPALAVVAAAHALALVFLLELTRTHPAGRSAGQSLTLVALPPAARPEALRLPLSPGAVRRERAIARPGETRAPESLTPAPDRRPAAIDWAAEGAEAASRVARGEDGRPGPRTFGMPPASAMFAPAPPGKPGFAWNYARTHRVEALPGGVTVFNLNDHCSIALLWVVPFLGCQLGKIPARGDLFDHLHDPQDRGGY